MSTATHQILQGIAFCNVQGRRAERITLSREGYAILIRSLYVHHYETRHPERKELLGLPYTVDPTLIEYHYRLTNNAKTIMVEGTFNE